MSAMGGGNRAAKPSVITADMVPVNRINLDREEYHLNFFSSRIGIMLHPIPTPNRNLDPNGNVADTMMGEPCNASFVVCGFRDYKGHQRPVLGSRLVAVDGISVEYGSWTLRTVVEKIKCRSEAGSGLLLTFRNDVLSDRDVAWLGDVLELDPADYLRTTPSSGWGGGSATSIDRRNKMGGIGGRVLSWKARRPGSSAGGGSGVVGKEENHSPRAVHML